MSSDIKIAFSRPMSCRAAQHNLKEIAVETWPAGVDLKKIKSYLAKNQVDVFVGGRYTEPLAFQRGLARCLPSKYKMILLDVEWCADYRTNRSIKSVLRKRLARFYKQTIAQGVSFLQAFSEADADNYAQFYGIDRKKFVFIPYCSVIDDSSYPVKDGDYLFTGGHNDRDYPTLFQAVKGLPIRLRVAADKTQFQNRGVPENVDILGSLGKDDFYTQLAQSKAVVLSVSYNSLRYSGVITYVEAMRLGKAVIVNDTIGAKSYITHREHGLLVPNADPVALQDAIVELLESSSLTEKLSKEGQEHSMKNFGYERYFADIHRLAQQAADNP